MASKKKPGDTEEYQYQGDEQQEGEYAELPPEEEELAPPQMSLLERLKNRRVLVPVGIILAVIVVYLYMGRQESRQAALEGQQDTSATQQVAQKQTQQQPKTTKTTTVSSAALLQTDTLNTEISKLQKQNKQDAAQLNQLQTKVNELGLTLGNLNESVRGLGQMVKILTDDMTNLKAAQSKPKVVKRAPVRRVRQVRAPIYYLGAVVTGRAWLKTADGKTTTVKVGDSLAGYGRIRVIDPRNGRVTTSSGKVIRYSKADS